MKYVFGLVLAVATVASAANIDVVLQQANPGIDAASDTVNVILQNNGAEGEPALGGSVGIRLAQFDLDNMVGASGWTWDFSSLVVSAFYATFGGPTEAAVYSSLSPLAGFIWSVPNGGSLKVASFTIANPTPGFAANVGLDVTDPSAPDNNTGARVDYGFGVGGSPLPTTLWSGDGTLGGGTGVATFTPEPTALALLGLGAVVALRRRA